MLRDRAANNRFKPASDYLIGFRPPPFFLAGPAGYDAAFSLSARDVPELGVVLPERIDVHISGSALLYELD